MHRHRPRPPLTSSSLRRAVYERPRHWYGTRWAWYDHNPPFIEVQAQWANPAHLGEKGVKALVERREKDRRFDLDAWLKKIFTLPIREPLPAHPAGWHLAQMFE